jgi:hypothetical protein
MFMAMKSGCPKENALANMDILEVFAKLVAAKERASIKHSLVASSVSVQSRVYMGEEVISNLRMTHEEIQARGEA